MKFLVKFLVIGLCLSYVYCKDSGWPSDLDKLELKKADMDAAKNLDVGRYSTMGFEYFNNQYLKAPNEHYIYNDSCIDESVETPICAFNDPYDRIDGYMTTITFCEIYFDNCRRGYRVWRTIDKGQCRFWYDSRHDDVFHTRKSSYPLIINLMKVLSSQPTNTKASTLKYVPEEFWTEPSTNKKWLKLEGIPIYNTDGIPNTSRRLNYPLAADLLKVLAKQSGNTQISVSKDRAPSMLPVPSTKKNRDPINKYWWT